MPTAPTPKTQKIPRSRTDRRLAELKRGGFYVNQTGIIVYTDASLLCHVPSKDVGIGIFWGQGTRADTMLSGERPPPAVAAVSQAEFYAVIRAIELHPAPSVRLEVRTDSKHAVYYFTHYAEWRDRNWRKRPRHGGGPPGKLVRDIDLLQRLGRALNALRCQVTVVHVRGHSGDWRNERADQLAKAAARGKLIIELSDEEGWDIESSDSDDSVIVVSDPEDSIIVVSDSEDSVIVVSDSEDSDDGSAGGYASDNYETDGGMSSETDSDSDYVESGDGDEAVAHRSKRRRLR